MIKVTVPYIDSEEANAEALERIGELWDARPGTPEEAELETLVTLVEAFEKKQYPINRPSPIAVVQGLMDRLGLNQLDLLPIFGSSSRASEFLNGKRSLSKDQAIALHIKYGLSLELLLGVYNRVPEEVVLVESVPARKASKVGTVGIARITR